MSEKDIRDLKDLAPGLRDPMALLVFVAMLAIFLYVLTLPGNALNPIGSNSTLTGYYQSGFKVLVFNSSSNTVGLLALVIPVLGFYFLREWMNDDSGEGGEL